jgi:DNA-directed RNA polymerase specialized sigma24 family protein
LPDVASAMGIPLGTAKSRLNHALIVMRRSAVADRGRADVEPVAGGQLA